MLHKNIPNIFKCLLTGIVIMNVHGIVALAVIHKVSAVLFMALIIVLLIHKAAMNKKA